MWCDAPLPNRLSLADTDIFDSMFSCDEIKQGVWDCDHGRALGPGGFSFVFFKAFWLIIEKDVVRFIEDFFITSHFPKGCNSSFIAWIPKITSSKFVFDFRPISMIGCQYKIIRKLLDNRLSSVIGGCVSPEQSAFIKGKNIFDGPMILNEIMEWYQK